MMKVKLNFFITLVALGLTVSCGNQTNWSSSDEDAMMSVSNISYLGSGLGAYAMDHGDRLPAADKWCDDIFREVQSNRKIYISQQAPNANELDLEEKHCHYAMNAALAGRSKSELPQNTVLLFETDLGWNGSGGLEDAQKFAKEKRRQCWLSIF